MLALGTVVTCGHNISVKVVVATLVFALGRRVWLFLTSAGMHLSTPDTLFVNYWMCYFLSVDFGNNLLKNVRGKVFYEFLLRSHIMTRSPVLVGRSGNDFR